MQQNINISRNSTMECSMFALTYSSVNHCIRFNNLFKDEKGFYISSGRLNTNRMSYLNVLVDFATTVCFNRN